MRAETKVFLQAIGGAVLLVVMILIFLLISSCSTPPQKIYIVKQIYVPMQCSQPATRFRPKLPASQAIQWVGGM